MGNSRSRPGSTPLPTPSSSSQAGSAYAGTSQQQAAPPPRRPEAPPSVPDPSAARFAAPPPPQPWRPPYSAPRPAPYPPPSRTPDSPQELTQTATICNAVNLKKQSLRLVPVPGRPGVLSIQFTFDASAPCAVSTFVLAREDPAAGWSLKAGSGAAPPASVAYDKGLSLVFPPGAPPPERGRSEPQRTQDAAVGTAAVDTRGHEVDLAIWPEERLLRAPAGAHALVVRLETITRAGLEAGHSLAELTPGGAQPSWVQSQTTYAALVRDEDGSLAARVQRQKIWVEGVSYELQEIYGLETSGLVPAAGVAGGGAEEASGSAADAEERLCVICLVNDRDTTVLPCRHMCMCHECAQELRRQTSKCPICRNHVESLLHIRVRRPQGEAKAEA